MLQMISQYRFTQDLCYMSSILLFLTIFRLNTVKNAYYTHKNFKNYIFPKNSTFLLKKASLNRRMRRKTWNTQLDHNSGRLMLKLTRHKSCFSDSTQHCFPVSNHGELQWEWIRHQKTKIILTTLSKKYKVIFDKFFSILIGKVKHFI